MAVESRTFAGIEFIWIEPGSFLMGSPETEKEREPDEQLREVTLTEGFWLGKYEVTQAQWRPVMGELPVRRLRVDEYPAIYVSREDCDHYTAKLNELGEGHFRLPTEAEWEYACRAGTTTPFYTGESITGDQANYLCDRVYGDEEPRLPLLRPVAVGSYPPNPWGLHDMAGNVREWCADWYVEDYVAPSPAADPQGPPEGVWRVSRGGSWGSAPWRVRSADRARHSRGLRHNTVGLRLCRDPDPEPGAALTDTQAGTNQTPGTVTPDTEE